LANRLEIMSTAQSRELFDRASRVMPRGNSRHSVFFTPHPFYCASGSGCRIVDADGREFLDFLNNFSSMIHGHGHPEVLTALHAQAARLIAVGLPTEAEIELAELLCERVRSVEQIRFMNSGTEAVMMAVKAARAFTQRPLIAKFEGCYHGTYDAVEVSQAPAPSAWGPADRPFSVGLSRGTPQSVVDGTLVLPFNDEQAIASALEQHRESLAAIIVDPSPAHLGYLQMTPSVLRLLRSFCDSCGTVLILDEVYSLRLDYHGAQHRFGVRPDLTVMGKIIGGGLPIGAVGGSRKIMEVFDPLPSGPAVVHGGTYNANPLSMATGLASMRALTHRKLDDLDRLGARLREGLTDVARSRSAEVVVEGLSSLASITFGRSPVENYRDRVALTGHPAKIAAFHRGMLEQGILLAPQGLIVLSTAMGVAEVDAFIRAADVVLRGMAKVA